MNFTLKFNLQSKVPLYIQLYSYIISEIKSGKIIENERLPSKKALSAHLNISKTTIENAYEVLLSEGYIKSIPRSGYYVLKYESPIISNNKTTVSSTIIENKKQLPNYKYRFLTNAVDTKNFPFSTWAKIAKNVMYNNPNLLYIGESCGDELLRKELIKYLHEYRGVISSPDNIIIGAGTEYLLDILCQLLGKKAIFALENPCYTKNYKILRDNDKKIIPISVDNSGIVLSELENTNANIVYITPSHQFPTGASMPIGRRTALLNWAASSDKYIIEDDYDSEFRYTGRPIPALQGLDQNNKVIYIGTLSRSIAPSIRIAYLILPDILMQKYKDNFNYRSSTVSRFEQHTLYNFMANGHFSRHLNRIRNIYRQKKDFLVKLLKEQFPKDMVTITGENAGLHFLISIKNSMTESELIKSAETKGIEIKGLSEYYIKNPKKQKTPTLVMGYSGLNENELKEAILLLKEVWLKNS